MPRSLRVSTPSISYLKPIEPVKLLEKDFSSFTGKYMLTVFFLTFFKLEDKYKGNPDNGFHWATSSAKYSSGMSFGIQRCSFFGIQIFVKKIRDFGCRV